MGTAVIKNCCSCNKEIKVVPSAIRSKNFCSRPCRDKVMYQHKFCGDAELLELSKNHTVMEIAKMFGSTYKNARRRVIKVKTLLASP